MSAKLVVLISGGGSNLQAVINACSSGELPASVVAVISNHANAFGLTRAQNAGIPAVVVEKLINESREAYDLRLAKLVSNYAPNYVLLAGWMRLLSNHFLIKFQNRVINLHPALPGLFAGTHAIERAYAAWQNGEIDRSGAMVHWVPDEGVDSGPVIAFEELLFEKGETFAGFEARMHSLEHRLLVSALINLIAKKE